MAMARTSRSCRSRYGSVARGMHQTVLLRWGNSFMVGAATDVFVSGVSEVPAWRAPVSLGLWPSKADGTLDAFERGQPS